MKTKKMVMVLAAMAALGSVSMANAGGFLGDLIENACGGCGVGKVADKWNAQNNNVFDHAAAKVVNGIVPGAGVALEAGWAIQRGNFGGMPPPFPGATNGRNGQWNGGFNGGFDDTMPPPLPPPGFGIPFPVGGFPPRF